MIHEGDSVKLTGKVTDSKYGLYLANPEFEKIHQLIWNSIELEVRRGLRLGL